MSSQLKLLEEITKGTTIVWGKKRKGKTSLLSMIGEYKMTAGASEDLHECKQIVKKLIKGGFKKLTVPKKHLVFSDVTMTAKVKNYPRRRSNEIDAFYFGLPNKQHPTMFLPPCAFVILGETQNIYDSRSSFYFPQFVDRIFATNGHAKINILMDCHRPASIDVKIRENVDRFIEVVKQKKTYDKYGRVTSTKWFCRIIEDYYQLEDYIKSGKQLKCYEEVIFVHKGNIFACYDSFSYFLLYLNGRENEDFDITPSRNYSYDLKSVKLYNATHGFEIPSTFYKRVKLEEEEDSKEDEAKIIKKDKKERKEDKQKYEFTE